MLKKYLALFLFLLFIAQAGFSNAKLFPGYYIDRKGDSIRCNIEFRDWNRNPRAIRVLVNNETRELTANDIRGFGVDAYGDYLSASITYHIGPVSGSGIMESYSDSVETHSWFLKILQNGHYPLYQLVLPQRSYFFTGHADTGIYELQYRTKQKENILEEDQTYKKQMSGLFEKEGLASRYMNRINRAAYTATDIVPLFSILNGGNTKIKNRKGTSGGFQADLFIGGILYSFPTAVKGDYSGNYKFNSDLSPAGGVNLLYSLGNKFNSLKFGISADYSRISGRVNRSGIAYFYSSVNYNDTTAYNETLSFSSSLLNTKLYVMYLVNPVSKIKAYVKGGLGWCVSLNSDRDIYTKSTASSSGLSNGLPTHSSDDRDHYLIKIKGSHLSFLAAAGVIKGRHKLELSYSPPMQLADETPTGIQSFELIPFKLGSFGLYYYFTLFNPVGAETK